MDIKILASGSTGNCYRISDGTTSLLLDAGIPINAIQRGCDFTLFNIDGCLITHSHNDHAKAGTELMKHSVDIYTSKSTAEAHGFSGHRLHIIKSTENFSIGTFDVLAFDVEHDTPETFGFLIYSRKSKEKLLYFTDTYYAKYTFSGLTHILCECNYDKDILMNNVWTGEVEPLAAKRITHSHMSIATLLEMLRANDLSRVQQIYLLHISGRNGDAQGFKERVQKLTGTEVYACY